MTREFWQGRPVVVTGGMGFIGSNTALRLAALGADVTVIDRMLAGYGANPNNIAGAARPITVIESDIGAEAAIAEPVARASVIFNLAGQTSHLDSMQQPLEDMALNQVSNLRFLELVRRSNPGARIIFSSTRQFYGPPQYLPVDEKHPILPPDINGIHKYAAEAYHMLFARVYGMKCTALRLTNVFGPRMRIRDAKQTFLGIWVRHAVQNTEFEVWGGAQRRDFSYVVDLVEALLAAARTDATIGQIYNIGGIPPVTLLDLAELLVSTAKSGRFSTREFPEERRKIDIGDYFCDDSPFRRITGWEPRYGLQRGLAETLDFYKANAGFYL